MNRRDVIKTGLAAAATSLVSPHILRAAPRLSTQSASASRERFLLDFGWRFHLGHADDPARDFGFGAGEMFSKVGRVFAPSRPNFDVSDWRPVDLPHDWAVELPFENAKELTEYGSKPLGRAYPATSIGWYRRTFDLPAGDAGRRIAIDFDGVFRDCMVVLNGNLLGSNTSGYAPFRFDVTDVVNFGAPNVLVVRVDATGREGWFYEGAGIYRHVWLEKTNPVHVAHWGSFVTSEVGRNAAAISVVTEIENESDAPVVAELRVVIGAASSAGQVDVPARGSASVTRKLTIDRPTLWSPDTPQLYSRHDDARRERRRGRPDDDALRRPHAALRRERRVFAQRPARSSSRGRATTRTTPASARRSRIVYSIIVSKDSRRWAPTPTARRTTRRRRSCSTPATRSACSCSTRRGCSPPNRRERGSSSG